MIVEFQVRGRKVGRGDRALRDHVQGDLCGPGGVDRRDTQGENKLVMAVPGGEGGQELVLDDDRPLIRTYGYRPAEESTSRPDLGHRK